MTGAIMAVMDTGYTRPEGGKMARMYQVEEHVGGREGVGQGSRTGTYATEQEAVAAMAVAKASGNGVTCIVRNRKGEGAMRLLGLVRA